MRTAMIPPALVVTCLSLALASPSLARVPGHRQSRSTVKPAKKTAFPMNPMAFWQGVAQATLAYQKDMARAYKRHSFMRKIGGPAGATLSNDSHSAFLGANSKFWQTAAKTTPWGAMLKASASPFYGPFGGLRVPTPQQYWGSIMRTLQPKSPPSSSRAPTRTNN